MEVINNKEVKEDMINGLKLTHLATGTPQEVPLNAKEVQLYFAGSNYGWDTACKSVQDRTGIQIQGNYEIDEIVINGIPKVFH